MNVRDWLLIFAAGTAALFAGGLVVGVVEMAGMLLLPPPAELLQAFEANDHQRIRELIGQLPFGSFLFVLLAYFLGSFCAGLVATAIAPKGSGIWLAMVSATFFLLAGIYNLLVIPHPLWFAVTSILLAFHLPAWWGAQVATSFRKNEQVQ